MARRETVEPTKVPHHPDHRCGGTKDRTRQLGRVLGSPCYRGPTVLSLFASLEQVIREEMAIGPMELALFLRGAAFELISRSLGLTVKAVSVNGCGPNYVHGSSPRVKTLVANPCVVRVRIAVRHIRPGGLGAEKARGKRALGMGN